MKKSKKSSSKSKKVTKNAPRKVSQSLKPSFGLTPLGDRVLVLEAKTHEENKTDSGIYIPAGVKEDRGSKRGVVVAVGRGRMEDGKLVAISVKVGETVLFGWGDSVSFEGKDYTIVREADISAIIS